MEKKKKSHSTSTTKKIKVIKNHTTYQPQQLQIQIIINIKYYNISYA
jgi:hypothetical protein